MKLFTTLLFTLFVTLIYSQETNCVKLREGKFKIVDEVTGDYYIERKGNKQMEYSSRKDGTVEFDVKWLDACTYQLSGARHIDGNAIDEDVKQMQRITVTTQIIEIKEHSYIARVTSDLSDMAIEVELFFVED